MRGGQAWFIVLILVAVAASGCSKKGSSSASETSGLHEGGVYDRAVGSEGFQVLGNLSGATTPLTRGTATLAAIDRVATDAEGTLDRADLLLDVTGPDGKRVHSTLFGLTSARHQNVSADFGGGVKVNQGLDGNATVGVPSVPRTHAFQWVAGVANVTIDNASVAPRPLVFVAATTGMRGADGAILAEADPGDLELHVLFPGSLLGQAGVGAQGFLYYLFDRVELQQLDPLQKAEVGSALTLPPRILAAPNLVASLVFANGSHVALAADRAVPVRESTDPAASPIRVRLDALNSTDPDGRPERLSVRWTVRGSDAEGNFSVYEANHTGRAVNHSFDEAGAKRVDVTVRDPDGLVANATLFFTVDYARTFTYTFPTGAGGGLDCRPSINCRAHSLPVEEGAMGLIVTVPSQTAGNCYQARVELVDDTNTIVLTSNPDEGLTVDDASGLSAGSWSLRVRWTAQAQCAYTFDAAIRY